MFLFALYHFLEAGYVDPTGLDLAFTGLIAGFMDLCCVGMICEALKSGGTK